ncbi:hypothetical protein H2199_006124 [Coniosporium tulheliwenetii]|uniref:Uncharacterized protein n=1 Tax=Coniosporium tulheliwenetii TaxID=3383036 RepID=A0ACC2YXJ2_9PEZI|nr:hypothetical protein H2199_006124 [Cladosporium sp. JES 115]
MGLFSRKKPSTPNAGSDAPLKANGAVKTLSISKTNGTSMTSTFRPKPDIPLPKAPDPALDPAGYLRSIYSVRERSRLVLEKAKKNQLKHFTVDMSKFQDTAAYVVSIIKRDFAPDYSKIPPHGRWQHFEVGGRPRIDQLLTSWPSTVDTQERTRRLIDLFVVSVLLDAGAGTRWQYRSKESGKVYRRSEGLAVASLEMFKAGVFSSDPAEPLPPLPPLYSSLLRPHRPLPTFWNVLMDGLAPIWPATRTIIDGIPIGDAWPCSIMPSHPMHPWENIVPFHKLTQWLAYSLMVPMQKLMHIHFAGAELMTGLPEYRNGGLFIDTGLLTLKPEDAMRGLEQYQRNAQIQGQPNVEVVPLFTADDDVIVEWRAATVGFLDELLAEVNAMLGLSGSDGLSLAQMLEAGSWKGGREIAEVSRPNTKEPPIMILSDGTVF